MTRFRPTEGPTISLFPFLAVLLCTMGALLVLLVLFSRSAKHADHAAAAPDPAEDRETLELAKEQLAWRRRQLEEIREKTAADLARARLQLAGVEDGARALADELASLERLSEALLQTREPTADDAAAIADLEQRLKDAREAIDKARKERADKPPAYAVVPYEGKNGTHRRPLYIECCIDGVFLQPEGIRLGPADFEGPPGPGNPLASGLRAAREHLARQQADSGDPAVQPYPLLLVRPSGVMAYYAAREAIQSWGSEFGYQFIDEDWTLTFPPRDQALAEAEMRAIEESRRRLAWLGQVRPVRAVKPTQQYRAATTRGGVVAEGGPSVLGDQSRFDWTEEQASGGRGGGGPGRGVRSGSNTVEGDATSDGGSTSGDVVLGAGGPGTGTGRSGAGRGGPAAGPGTGDGPGGAADAADGAALGSRYAGPSRFYSGVGDQAGGSAGAAGGSPGGTSADGDPDGGEGSASAGGTASGQQGSGQQGMANQAAGQPAGGGQQGGGQAGMQSGGAGGGGGAFGPSMPGQPRSGTAAGGMTGSPGSSTGGASGSLAGKRGSNWASLATHDRPIPLRRPIRVECAANELRILADGGNRVETRIPLGAETIDSIDLLVTAVHTKVGGWGIAGDRMYWKPELILSETVDGRSRREDLERLLADSGLDTRRSESFDRIRPLPPVSRRNSTPANR